MVTLNYGKYFNIVIIMRILIENEKKNGSGFSFFAFRKRKHFRIFFGGCWGKMLKSIEFSYRRKICRTGKKEQKEKFFFRFSFFFWKGGYNVSFGVWKIGGNWRKKRKEKKKF